MKPTLAVAMILVIASPVFSDWPWHHSKSSHDPSAAAASAAPSGPSTDPPTPLTPGPPYIIGLDDVLRISVWKEPEFSATVQVRSDGKISLPLLNDVRAVGYAPTELAASLTEQLRKYVDDPRVTVIVSSAKPRVVYMVGEVGRKGPMALTPNMTVLQALVTSGLTIYANTKKIYVMRTVAGVEQKFPVNYKKMVKGKSMNENILLQPGDMVVVP